MFRIYFSSRAKKEFDKLGGNRVEDMLRLLIVDPVPAKICDVKKLRGLKDTFRIRIGKIRIVYTVIWKDRTILISRVSHRESAYC